MHFVTEPAIYMIDIEVVYVSNEKKTFQRHLRITQGITVLEALKLSGLFYEYPETEQFDVGIFSKKIALDSEVKSGDRIEVYRPLFSHPMHKRRQRAITLKKNRLNNHST